MFEVGGIIRATTLFNLQRNNVALQIEGKCFPYYIAFKPNFNLPLGLCMTMKGDQVLSYSNLHKGDFINWHVCT